MQWCKFDLKTKLILGHSRNMEEQTMQNSLVFCINIYRQAHNKLFLINCLKYCMLQDYAVEIFFFYNYSNDDKYQLQNQRLQ